MTAEPNIGDRKQSLVTRAQAAMVIDDETYAAAGAFWRELKDFADLIREHHKARIELAHQAHKATVAGRDFDLKPVLSAIAAVETEMKSYKREQERLAQEAEEKRRKAEAAQRAKVEEARKTGAPLPAAPKPLPPEAVVAAPRAQGVSERQVWKATVNDMALLVKAVAEGKAPLGCLEVKLTPLAAWKNGFPEGEIPGVTFEKDAVMSRSRKP